MFTVTDDRTNRDIPAGMDVYGAKAHYLAMREGFVSKLSPPVVTPHGDKWVFRGDLSQVSLKGYGAEQLVAQSPGDTLVYVAPRAGMAPNAIATLAGVYGKKCVFFCPAAKELSMHQRALLYHGAELRFAKIVRMPNLNGWAKKWAESRGAHYLPPGLSNEPLVTAGLVKLAGYMSKQMGGDPTEIWMSVSTGTAIRAFQIAWPETKVRGVAVARNMQSGEIGKAELTGSALPFLKPVAKELRPPFDSTVNYDAKCWRDFEEKAAPGAIFINVGSDAVIQSQYEQVKDVYVDSQRAWGDKRDLDLNN
jgi:hypothetical protein